MAITFLFIYKNQDCVVWLYMFVVLDKEPVFINNQTLHISVDITVFHNGYHGDLNETFFVGEVDEGAKRLVQTTYECLMQAIDAGKKDALSFSLVWLF